MKRITVHSYRGGTGKSLIALNLAYQLSQQNKRVLLVETDIRMPSFQKILGISPKFTFNDFYEEKCKFFETIARSKKGFSVISCSSQFTLKDRIFSAHQQFHAKMLKSMLASFRSLASKFDFCIIDSAPGWGFIQINNGLLAQKIVLVLRVGLNAFSGTMRMIDDVYKKTYSLGKKFAVIWNQVPVFQKIQPLIEEWETSLTKKMKIANFYQINYIDEIVHQIATGVHILEKNVQFQQKLTEILEFCKQ